MSQEATMPAEVDVPWPWIVVHEDTSATAKCPDCDWATGACWSITTMRERYLAHRAEVHDGASGAD